MNRSEHLLLYNRYMEIQARVNNACDQGYSTILLFQNFRYKTDPSIRKSIADSNKIQRG